MTLTPEVGKELHKWLEYSDISTKLGQINDTDRLAEEFAQLGLNDLWGEYQGYACERYGVNAVNVLMRDQVAEQITLLKQCLAREDKLSQFSEILRNRKLAA